VSEANGERATRLGRGGPSGARALAREPERREGGLLSLPRARGHAGAGTPGCRGQITFSVPVRANARVQLQGALQAKSAIADVRYLMLGHNLMHSSPCLLQHLVRWLRFG